VDVDTACKAIETSRWIRNDAIATQSLAISRRGQSAQLRGYSASLLAVSSTEACRAQRLAKKVKLTAGRSANNAERRAARLTVRMAETPAA
jgi:hypothetical protein